VLSDLTTNQKGAIAEAAIALTTVKLGIDVYKPLVDGGRYDLIFDVESRLVRVQCKWATHRGSVIVVPCYSARRTRDGLSRRLYTADEIDAYAAYCRDLDTSYFLPIEQFAGRTYIQLRLDPTRNNQRGRINWANDFELIATLRRQAGP
jgi:hypothetical protein